MVCKESPEFCLTLLPTRGRSQTVAVQIPPKALALLVDLTFPFLLLTSVFLSVLVMLNTTWLVFLLISYLYWRPSCVMTFPLILFSSFHIFGNSLYCFTYKYSTSYCSLQKNSLVVEYFQSSCVCLATDIS